MKGFSLIKSFEYVLIMTLAQLPGYFSVAWLIERIGRKAVLIIYLTGTALSAYFFGNADSAAALMTFGALLSFSTLGHGERFMPIHQSNIQLPFARREQAWLLHSDALEAF